MKKYNMLTVLFRDLKAQDLFCSIILMVIFFHSAKHSAELEMFVFDFILLIAKLLSIKSNSYISIIFP